MRRRSLRKQRSSQHCFWRGDSQPLVHTGGRNPHRGGHRREIHIYIHEGVWFKRGEKRAGRSFKADTTRRARRFPWALHRVA